MNLLELPYFQFDAPWWTAEGIEALTINGRMYMAGGDIAVSMLENMQCMYFNKRLAEEYRIEDIYQTVRSGKWTHDKFMEIVTSVGGDLNGDAVIDKEDLFGFTTRDEHVRPYLVAYETPTLGYEDGALTCIWNTERTQAVVEALVDMTSDSSVYYDRESDSLGVRLGIFQSGRSLIMADRLGAAAKLREMNDDFGIIPYPKLDEAQESYTNTSGNSVTMMTIPITAPDPDISALLIEALCRESHDTITPAYYEVALQGKYVRDENSREMIELIREGLSFDTGWVSATQTNVTGQRYSLLCNDGDKNFASWYASQESAIAGAIEKFSAAYYE